MIYKKVKHAKGYIMVYVPWHQDAHPNGYMLEHRFVMGYVLGRRLRSNEVVHHINGDKEDNRPENLRVTTNAEHSSLHSDKIDLDEAARLYEAGMSPGQVDRHFGVYKGSVKKAFKNAGRLSEYPLNRGNKYNKVIDWKLVKQCLERGYSIADTARVFGISECAIYKRRKRGLL